jgi:hypothetical protein
MCHDSYNKQSHSSVSCFKKFNNDSSVKLDLSALEKNTNFKLQESFVTAILLKIQAFLKNV